MANCLLPTENFNSNLDLDAGNLSAQTPHDVQKSKRRRLHCATCAENLYMQKSSIV